MALWILKGNKWGGSKIRACGLPHTGHPLHTTLGTSSSVHPTVQSVKTTLMLYFCCFFFLKPLEKSFLEAVVLENSVRRYFRLPMFCFSRGRLEQNCLPYRGLAATVKGNSEKQVFLSKKYKRFWSRDYLGLYLGWKIL